jgi:hypothetical protein
MSNFKEKAQVFIIGLSIGLLIAGAFFILKLDDYFKELNLYKKVSQTFIPVKDHQAIEEETHVEEKQKKIITKTSKKVIEETDSTEINQKEKQLAEKDTTKINKSDTLFSNTLLTPSDDIIVKKDELLSTKTVEVYNLNPVASKLSGKDSLLQKVSGIKDDKITGKQMFNVEFWQSPLNYKGYRMSKYKIILYGIGSAEGLKLYKLDDIIYLKLSSNIYKLDYAADFRQYDRITDELIINKLK